MTRPEHRTEHRTRDRVRQAMDQISVAPRMERMATLFGAAPAMTQAEAWRSRDMTERCVSCRHTAECARVLCTPDAEPVLAGFCPNVGHFRTLASRLRDGSIFVAPATEDRLTWPEREAAWDHRCDSPSDS